MASPPHGVPASPPPEPGLGAGLGSAEADDDTLIEKLRARAWDPGLRFDAANVPAAWMTERYGSERLEQIQDDIVSYGMDGTIELKAQAQEVSAYYAGAPRGPLFPPATLAEVEDAECRIGRRLPDLLRRVYTEVADGGFGPDSGLASLTDGNRAPGHLNDWPSAVRVHERKCAAGLPASWLYLAAGGCTMEWHVSLAATGNPVLLYDADGGDVWDEALGRL